MHLLSTEESNIKLNPRSTTTRPDLLLRLLVLRVTAPFGRCACADCANYHRIACAKRRSTLCTTKSADGANPHFAHNIYTQLSFTPIKFELRSYHMQTVILWVFHPVAVSMPVCAPM